MQNFTLDGTGGGGTMSVGGVLDLETSGDAFQNKALNLMFENIAFAAADGNVLLQGEENSNITFDRDTFVDGNSNSGCTSLGAQFYLLYQTATPTTPSGVTVENSVFVASTDMWNPNRAIQTEPGMTANDNVFVGFLSHNQAASCNHIDSFFLYSGSPGTYGSDIFTGNLCYDDYNCMAGYDGTQKNTITDNVCFDIERTGCITLESDVDSVINHNTMETDGADPGHCAMNEPATPVFACTASELFQNGHKSGDPTGSGEVYTNDASDGGPSISDSSAVSTNTNNLWSGASSPNINGTPTFAGGANPTTWAGFELTAGSAGHNGASDGLDVGIRSSAGGPPTGGGSAPANTAAPTLIGTATEGDTLTTTNGTWTITGNVPTATTYQWFDCPTATLSLTACTPIEAQTSPTSTNATTYTLQASDVGDYIFSYVTETNANGMVSATSNAAGPVTS